MSIHKMLYDTVLRLHQFSTEIGRQQQHFKKNKHVVDFYPKLAQLKHVVGQFGLNQLELTLRAIKSCLFSALQIHCVAIGIGNLLLILPH